MNEPQLTDQELKNLFPEIPEACADALLSAACSVQEEEPMRKRMSVRRGAVLALTLICVAAAALAAFAPRITALFGEHYGAQFQTWLEGGRAAPVAASLTVEKVDFALTEVAQRNRALYAMGTITPQQGAVLVATDCTTEEPWGYDVHHGDQAPEGAATIAQKAAETGAAIYAVDVFLEGIGVDGGTVLAPDCWGYDVMPQRDGSIIFLLELDDGSVVEPGETYTLEMSARVQQLTADGQPSGEPVRVTWTAEAKPAPIQQDKEG